MERRTRRMEELEPSLNRLVLTSQALATLYHQGAKLEDVAVKVDEMHALVTHLRHLIEATQDATLALDLEQQDRDDAAHKRTQEASLPDTFGRGE
jgi:hypothetical protein